MAKDKNREHQTVAKEEVGAVPAEVVSATPAPTPNLPALPNAPPSFLVPVATQDEVSGTFGEMTADQPRNASEMIPLAVISHKDGRFNLAGCQQDVLEGYPIYGIQVRGWWKDQYKPGQHTPPTCWAADAGPLAKPSVMVAEPQSKDCASCKFSKFGSARQGSGQACRVTSIVFLANPEFGDPPLVALCLPPSSIRPLMGGGRTPGYIQSAKNFVDPVTKRKAKYSELVWTRIGLLPGGDLHHVIDPKAVSVCRSADEARALAKIRGEFLESMERLRGDVQVVTPAEDGTQE